MKPTFLNWPLGVLWNNPVNDTRGLFGHWWPTILFSWIEGEPPLIWQDESGLFHRLVQRTGTTDFGSIPWGVRVLPGLGTLTYRLPYLFHDDCYQTHEFYVSRNGTTWELMRVNRQQADERLRDMVRTNPTDPGGAVSANIILAGVRMGGSWPWNNSAHRKRIMAAGIALPVNPYGTDHIIKKA